MIIADKLGSLGLELDSLQDFYKEGGKTILDLDPKHTTIIIQAIRLLLKKGNSSDGEPVGKVVCTTGTNNIDLKLVIIIIINSFSVFENAPMLDELLDVKPTGIIISININNFLLINIILAFLPSIPHLVYQYNLYTNYKSQIFCIPNKEIPE